MAELRKFNRLVRDFANESDFLTVYIEEAHASDGWKFENNYDINHHRSLDDRVKAAQFLLKEGIEGSVVLDNMNDECGYLFAAVPERLYVILDGVIVFQGDAGPSGYSVDKLREWLQKYFSKHTRQEGVNGTSPGSVANDDTGC